MLLLCGVGGCRDRSPLDDAPRPAAEAEIRDSSGAVVARAALMPEDEGVAIELEVVDLPPGMHALHIHENGACEAPDFKSAGGHFNPLGADHGHEDGDSAHLGDLPNIAIGSAAEPKIRVVAEGVNLDGRGVGSLLAGDGTSLVIHAGADDYRTDPAGNAGPRIGCGVIRAS
jgi:Cu-Zn family superoxide dismutase